MSADKTCDELVDKSVSEINVSLNQNSFLLSMIRELSGALQDVVGLEDARGFISIVGGQVGDEIDSSYKKALSVQKISRKHLSEVLIDFKRRIGGNFKLESEDDDKIVFTNTLCPYAENVTDRPALCLMTTNVFGRIAANNLGYARVDVAKSIAAGAQGCRVVVYLNADEGKTGQEYFEVN